MKMKYIPSAISVLTLLSSPAWAQNDAPSKQPKEIVLDFREAKDATSKPQQDKRFTSLAEQKALLEARIKAHEKFMRHMRTMNEKMPIADPAMRAEQDKKKRELLEKLNNKKEQNPEMTLTREGNEAELLRLVKIGEQMKNALREVEKNMEKEGK